MLVRSHLVQLLLTSVDALSSSHALTSANVLKLDSGAGPATSSDLAEIKGVGQKAAAREGSGRKTAASTGAGKASAIELGIGHKTAAKEGSGQMTAAQEGSGQKTAAKRGVGIQAASQSGIGIISAAEEGSGRETAEKRGVGIQAAAAQGIGQQAAVDAGVGHESAAALGSGQKTAAEQGVGVAAAEASGIGYRKALNSGVGQTVAIERGVGVAAAQASKSGRTTALINTRSKCVGANPNFVDIGYDDDFRGWYDIQGCGKCEDYCRWVGVDAGSGGDPSKQLRHGNAWWSCRLAGSTKPYTPRDHFQSFTYKRCAYKGQDTCFLPQATEEDPGFNDEYRGWYDVQGCGTCNDYCRWKGNSGSGGDPAERRVMGTSYWSCRLAGSTEANTVPGHFPEWNFKKCGVKGEDACLPASTSDWDEGYRDDYRGWYDLQGCGSCNDYCRWVGLDGPGGDPSKRLAKGNSWWSCRLAGKSETYTPKEYFSSWNYTLCNNGPGIRAAHAQHAGQKTAADAHVGVAEAHYEHAGISAAEHGVE